MYLKNSGSTPMYYHIIFKEEGESNGLSFQKKHPFMVIAKQTSTLLLINFRLTLLKLKPALPINQVYNSLK